MATDQRIERIHDAKILRQRSYGHGYFVMELACPELAATIDVGQFVNLRVHASYAPLLRRPFSVFDVLYDAANQPTGISILYHVVGKGTAMMSRMADGESVSLTGPLGQPYPEPPADAAVIMVGGGIGLAPFLLQSKRYIQANQEREHVLIAGGRTDKDLKYMALFTPCVKVGLNLLLCTEDGSLGVKGRVTDPLRDELESRARKDEAVYIYCCGPTPMMEAVARLSAEFEVAGIASLESIMACGYGVCNGCVTRVKDPAASGGFRYVKTCTVGPAFDAQSLLWD